MDSSKKEKRKKQLYTGPISSEKVSIMIANHQPKTGIGGHALFLGQVRADEIEGVKVTAIEYSAYEEMAENALHDIKEEAFDQFDLSCLHILHSIGKVKVGEISLCVMVSSKHSQPTYGALEYIVQEVKKRVPIWKKELLEDGTVHWVEGKGQGTS